MGGGRGGSGGFPGWGGPFGWLRPHSRFCPGSLIPGTPSLLSGFASAHRRLGGQLGGPHPHPPRAGLSLAHAEGVPARLPCPSWGGAAIWGSPMLGFY